MPNETTLKTIIRDAIFEAHNTHGSVVPGDRLLISREDSTTIANAVYDALKAASAFAVDEPKNSN